MNAEPQRKRVLLAGASGYIGQRLAAELTRRGYQATTLCRPDVDAQVTLKTCREPHSAPTIAVDLSSRATTRQQLGNTTWDAVISCMASRTGAPDDAWAVDYRANSNLLAATNRAGSHFMLLSAICVQRPRLAFQHAKLKFEAELAQHTDSWSVVRPTAFFKSLAGQLQRLQAGKPYLMFGDGTLTACKPISAADLARFMVQTLEQPRLHNQVLPIGGPGPALTPRDQGEMLFELLGLTPRFRSVPPGLLAGMATCLGAFGRLSAGVRQKSELLKIGHYYATESMLVWDEQAGRYRADATPEFGQDTLADYYNELIRHGLAGESLGAHKLF